MPGGERLWRTEKGDLVGEGHPEALLLAYGVDDELSTADDGNVRRSKQAAKPANKQAPKAANKQAAPPKNK